MIVADDTVSDALCERCGTSFVPTHNSQGRFCSNKCSAIARTEPLPVRFQRSFIPEPNSGCWLWVATTSRLGYGMIRENGKSRSAHRVSYEMHKGPVGDLDVLHRCDVRGCVNPEHLFLGTHAENMSDMVRKGRSPRATGSAHHQAKLTEADVLKARLEGVSAAEFAKMHGIHRTTARRALSGKRWGHI